MSSIYLRLIWYYCNRQKVKIYSKAEQEKEIEYDFEVTQTSCKDYNVTLIKV